MWRVKTNYYKIKKVVIKGKRYDSKFEAEYAIYLENEKKKGNIKRFETHKAIDLISNGYKVGRYYIDFVVYHNDGAIEYVETKGFPTTTWKLKWKIFCSMYKDDPNIKLTLIKQGSFGIRGIKKYEDFTGN